MTKRTYVMRDGKLVEVTRSRKNDPKIHVIVDSMDAAQHPCNGFWYESKKAFRDTTRAHGCVEIGNETMKDNTNLGNNGSASADIRSAIEKLERRGR